MTFYEYILIGMVIYCIRKLYYGPILDDKKKFIKDNTGLSDNGLKILLFIMFFISTIIWPFNALIFLYDISKSIYAKILSYTKN